MKLKIFQKYFITCLLIDNKINCYTVSVTEFKKKFQLSKHECLLEKNILSKSCRFGPNTECKGPCGAAR